MVRLEVIAESLVGSVDELSFVTDSLKEGIVDFILNVVVVELGLFLLVIVEKVLHLLLKFVLLLVKVADDGIILFLLIIINSFKVGVLLPEASELLDLRS